MALITLENVSYTYPEARDGKKALSHVTLSIEKGSFVAILGSNGSGKSTLGKLLNGLLLPQEGKVEVDGLDSRDKKNIVPIRKSVGIVFQNPDNQIVADTVEEDVAFGPENLNLPTEEIQKSVDESLASTGLSEIGKSKPEKLSGGQKQRVAIAGVLAMHPKCIVLDEATAMLDPQGRREVLEQVKRLRNERNLAVILITHHMDEVVDADVVYVLEKGTLAFSGTPKEVFRRKEELEMLGLTLPLSGMLACTLESKGLSFPSIPLNKAEILSFLKKKLEEKQC